MTQRTISIEEASAAELREFAVNTLGLDIHANSKRETILAKIGPVWDKPEITVSEAELESEQVGPTPQPVTAAQQPPEPEKVRIHIAIQEGAGGQDPVPVAVNGKAMAIPRGKDVSIPVPYYEVLRNAVTHKYDVDDNGSIIPTPREVPLYPVSRVA